MTIPKRTIHDEPLTRHRSPDDRKRERALNALIEIVEQLRSDMVLDRTIASVVARRLIDADL